MIRYLFWLVLAISLLFNVFFGLGYLQARAQGELASEADQVARRVTEELNLDDGQRTIFKQLRSGLKEDLEVYGDALALSEQELLEELGRNEPDLERVRSIVARQAELHEQRRQASGLRFREFLGVLSPEQCQALSHHMRQGPPGPHHRLLERFDANGDGRLDESEEQAAREFIEQHRQEREQRRQEHLEQFDADGDGVLDPEERTALREWLRENHPEGRPEHRGPGEPWRIPGSGAPGGPGRPGPGRW